MSAKDKFFRFYLGLEDAERVLFIMGISVVILTILGIIADLYYP